MDLYDKTRNRQIQSARSVTTLDSMPPSPFWVDVYNEPSALARVTADNDDTARVERTGGLGEHL